MSSLELKFGTALTGVNPETGGKDVVKFEVIAKQLRGHIMSQATGDGITGMWIERYGMRVEYLSELITAKQVLKAVDEALAWLINSNKDSLPFLFNPNDKGIDYVSIGRHEGQPDNEAHVEATFRTNLYEYPASNAELERLHEELRRELLQLRGVRTLAIFINRIFISVIQELTSAKDAKRHIKKILSAHAMDEESKFMPYTKHQPVDIAWNIEE
jgi:hypothetical protein